MNHLPEKLFSLLSVQQLYSIYHLLYDKNYVFNGESHDFWEFSYIIKGVAGVTIGDKVYILGQGDAVFTCPNVFHNVWAHDNNIIEIFTIAFDGSGFDQSMPYGKFTLLKDEIYSIYKILDEIPATFKGYNVNEYTNLISISSPNDVGYQIIKNHLELLCLSIKRRGHSALKSPSQDNRAIRYSEIVAYLKENIQKSLTIDDICRDNYETPGTLKSIFKQFTGGGVIKFYNHLRCEHSMQLIINGLSMKEIADIMNFSSQFYFTYFFKRELGITPTKFKSSIINKQNTSQFIDIKK